MKIILRIFALCFLFLLSNCSDNAIQDNILKFGVDATYKPYAYIENGELKGFDVDFNRLIAKELGMEAKMFEMDWEQLIPAL